MLSSTTSKGGGGVEGDARVRATRAEYIYTGARVTGAEATQVKAASAAAP